MKKLILAAAVAVGLASAANAALVNGTAGFIPVGDSSYTGPDIGDATSVSVSPIELINSLPPLYKGNPNDLASVWTLGDVVSLSTTTLTPGGSLTLSFSGGGSEVVNNLVFTTINGNALGISGTDLLTVPGFDPTAANFTASFTQSGVGGAVNGGFSLSTGVVPEPSTVAAGLGALGLCLAALRARKQSA